MKKILTLTLAVLMVIPAAGKSLEERMKQCMDKYGAIGVSVAVVRDNRIIYVGEFGSRDISGTPFSGRHDDIYRIASISKTWVGTAIMQLVDEGRINLDDDAQKYLPVPLRHPEYPNTVITVRMLLNHTAAVSRSTYKSLDYINPKIDDEWFKSYKDWEPGTKYKYSNLGFNILAAIIENASGERFDKYVRKHIVEPLGLNASFNPRDLDPELFVPLYKWDKKGKTFKDQSKKAYGCKSLDRYRLGYDAPVFSGAGGMKICARDLATYMLMHMNGGEWNGVRIISRESSRLMQTYSTRINAEGTSAYGLAMRKKEDWCGGKTVGGHLGSAYGLYSTMDFNAEEGWGIVTLCNGAHASVSQAFDNVLYKYFIEEGNDR